jgi:hypothetical protein
MNHPRDRRIPAKTPVSFEGKSGTGRGTTFNLSLNGCALESRADVAMGSTIKLHLHIPTAKQPVRVGKAQVIWTAGDDIGVEFLDMNETGKARLQAYIEQLKGPTQKPRSC